MTDAVTRDLTHMRHALVLAARGLGQVAPNPAVGCVIVSPQGHIIGVGWTQRGGRPHAETEALKQAGDAARGATAYVTLEPCAHTGKTPPCADALISAGVARVVAAVSDPDPRVAGQGFARLEQAGIETVKGVCEAEAAFLNEGFFRRVIENRPMIALKAAESMDGFISDGAGHIRWITSEDSRRHAHLLRATYDAILVGIGTVLADDPELTCRLPGLEDRSPVRVVMDSRLRIPLSSKLVQSARDIPVIVATAAPSGGEGLIEAGVDLLRLPNAEGRVDVHALARELAAKGITRLLVEGGTRIHSGFLDEGLADRLYLYRAPFNLGSGAISALRPVPAGFIRTEYRFLGPDVLESYAVRG